MTDVRAISRRLRDLAEPIAGSVYFAPEAFDAYRALGLDDYAQGYFCSRGACLGRPSGRVVAAAFGVFNPDIVLPAVEAGWSKTSPDAVLDARLQGATMALRRMLGEADPRPAVAILHGVMESRDHAGRALFSGLLSLPFPDDPVAQLWRVCDYVRERRGDGHIAAWISAGCDAIEIGLLTELYWGLDSGTYIRTRGWTQEQLDDGVARLEEKGYIRDRALTDEGLEYRRGIEAVTDEMESDVVRALGERAGELFGLLEPWTKAVLDARGYPADPSLLMNRS